MSTSDDWRQARALFELAMNESLIDPADAGDDAIAPGTVLGTYTVVRELGRGGMGRVYLATDARLNRDVALKAVAPALVGNADYRERLKREARAAAALTHPGICTVYALEEISGDVYLASEYIDGTTLREEILSGELPSPAEMVRTARDVASALAAAHARGITHRDLKPDNIMRTRDGRIKILDFGLARLSTSAGADHSTLTTHPGMLVGTPAYMAPEQLTGSASDARSDVFAFGVLVYEYASGVHPFAAASPLATMARVLESDVRPLPDRCPSAPAEILEVVARCLKKSAAERPQSALEIVHALDRHPAAGPASPTGTTRRSNWWLIHQLAVMALYVGGAALGWLLKYWLPTPTTIGLFIALGGVAAIGGGLRGHLAFTARMNRPSLAREWRRLRPTLVAVDLAMAAGLFLDAILVARWPLTAVWTMALAIAFGLVALVLDPATSAAIVGDERRSG